MAVSEIENKGVANLPKEYTGLTTDTKPKTGVPEGSTFYEHDGLNLTNIYMFLSGDWRLI